MAVVSHRVTIACVALEHCSLGKNQGLHMNDEAPSEIIDARADSMDIP